MLGSTHSPLNSPGQGAFEQLVESWLGAQRSARTRDAYGADVAAFGRWCARVDALPLRISPADVVAYQAACVEAGASPSTVRRRNSSLSSFFRFALAQDAVATNPVAGTERPHVTVGDPSSTPDLSAEALSTHLRDAAALDGRLHALVALLALVGVKLGEALALDVPDIVGRGRSLSAVVSRSSGSESLRLHTEAGRAVRRIVAGRTDGPLFVGRTATPLPRLTRFGADHLLKRLPVSDGLPITANRLRRHYVASMHAAGVALTEIRTQAGLSDVRGARRYLDVDNNQHAGDGSSRQQTIKEE